MPDTTIEYSIIDNGGRGTVSVVLDGLHVLPAGHPNYAAVVAALTGQDLSDAGVRARLKGLLTGTVNAGAEAQDQGLTGGTQATEPQGPQEDELSERVVLVEGALRIDGQAALGSLPDRIVELIDDGHGEAVWAPLVRLLEKQVDTGDDGLYEWAFDHDAAINVDGSVVAYLRTVAHPSGAYGVEMDLRAGQYVARVVDAENIDDELVTTVLVEPADLFAIENGDLLVHSTRVASVGRPAVIAEGEGGERIAHLRPVDNDGYGIAGQLASLLAGRPARQIGAEAAVIPETHDHDESDED